VQFIYQRTYVLEDVVVSENMVAFPIWEWPRKFWICPWWCISRI